MKFLSKVQQIRLLQKELRALKLPEKEVQAATKALHQDGASLRIVQAIGNNG